MVLFEAAVGEIIAAVKETVKKRSEKMRPPTMSRNGGLKSKVPASAGAFPRLPQKGVAVELFDISLMITLILEELRHMN